MPIITTFTASLSMGIDATNIRAGDETGPLSYFHAISKNFGLAALPPEIEGGGIAIGTFTAVEGTGTLLKIADPVNIRSTGGTGAFVPAVDYLAAGKRLRAMILENQSLVVGSSGEYITVSVPVTGGLAGLGWAASAVICRLHPLNGAAMFLFPEGSAALVTGTNDGLLFVAEEATPTAAAITPSCKACFIYG